MYGNNSCNNRDISFSSFKYITHPLHELEWVTYFTVVTMKYKKNQRSGQVYNVWKAIKVNHEKVKILWLFFVKYVTRSIYYKYTQMYVKPESST